MMSFATFSVSVPSTANMFPPIAAVFVSFAEPPPYLRFLRPLERLLPTTSRLYWLARSLTEPSRGGEQPPENQNREASRCSHFAVAGALAAMFSSHLMTELSVPNASRSNWMLNEAREEIELAHRHAMLAKEDAERRAKKSRANQD